MAQSAVSAGVLDAAKTGNLVQLQSQLAGFKFDAKPAEYAEYPKEATDLICAAAQAHRAEVVRWLIYERFPEWKPHLRSHLQAIGGGPAVYDVFLSKWPDLMDRDLGHNGNPIGLSAFSNDRDMVKFLLSKGVDPNTAHYSGRYFDKTDTFPALCRNIHDNIINMLIEHGLVIPEGVVWPPKRESKRHCMVM